MLKKLLFSFGLVLSTVVQADDKLDALLSEIWQFELEIDPISATSLGVHQYDHLLPDVSAEGLEKQWKKAKSYLTQLDKIAGKELDSTSRINLLMQRYRLQDLVDQYEYKAHLMPITSEYGFHSSLAFLPRTSKFGDVKDYQNYLSRLEAFPNYFRQQMAWMREGLRLGLTQPRIVLEGFEETALAFVHDNPKDSVFYQPFADLSTLPKEQAAALQKQALAVIQDKVFPSYQAFHAFLENEYLPRSKSDIAAKSWPRGEEFYQNRVRHYTTTSMSAEEIHQLGLEEVKRIRAEMKEVMQASGFKGDHAQFIEFLRTDPQFYATSAEQLIKEATYLSKMADAALPQLFHLLPRTPYGVAPVPESIAPKYTTGRYISPSRDDQPGYYWVNTYALDKRPLYELPALTLHEAVPGHHLQIALAREMKQLPPVRRYTYISAFGEGWGLYSEYLGKEIGFYKTPYDNFGRLSYEMWRACRLVVDTGMHMMGWSRQQAIDFMLENTALSAHNVTTEIDRYISWPAQALSYKIGEITIKNLRAKAEQQLGKAFDLREFHDVILQNGSIPLDVLRMQVDNYLKQKVK
ncbi:DUF885 domain-containing protein [Aliiglaciecola sp. CAU 1673]|uniref:DUF885 domain-containing protein n=1 Tax=Aliiglaciecola sp. CAU 1673 TaxID=3032595 RepID=UPI0023DC9515|nr:DUF885 domain-containing protein [Aliiglaciecola sp. CAU 1673]MDF2179294.1 DUF885 domain-containing protein [Aliiglaciecola sp. CAU 1673]